MCNSGVCVTATTVVLLPPAAVDSEGGDYGAAEIILVPKLVLDARLCPVVISGIFSF